MSCKALVVFIPHSLSSLPSKQSLKSSHLSYWSTHCPLSQVNWLTEHSSWSVVRAIIRLIWQTYLSLHIQVFLYTIHDVYALASRESITYLSETHITCMYIQSNLPQWILREVDNLSTADRCCVTDWNYYYSTNTPEKRMLLNSGRWTNWCSQSNFSMQNCLGHPENHTHKISNYCMPENHWVYRYIQSTGTDSHRRLLCRY